MMLTWAWLMSCLTQLMMYGQLPEPGKFFIWLNIKIWAQSKSLFYQNSARTLGSLYCHLELLKESVAWLSKIQLCYDLNWIKIPHQFARFIRHAVSSEYNSCVSICIWMGIYVHSRALAKILKLPVICQRVSVKNGLNGLKLYNCQLIV